ncbi:MAG: glycosyltransferase family 39 protein [Flavobacterium sp.]
MNIINAIKKNNLLIFILLLATFLRFYHLDFQSLWMDEIYTMNVSNPAFSFEKLREEVVVREGFPYLYFVLLRIFYFFTEYSGLVARSVSAIAGVLGVYFIYLLGKEIFNKNVGLIAAFLLCINDFHISYSQEARPYTLFVLFALISFYRLSLFLKETSLRNALFYGLSIGLMLNINFFGLITLFSQALLILFYIILSKRADASSLLKKSLLSGIIGLVLFLPNYKILIKLLNFKSFWIPRPTENALEIVFSKLLGNSEIILYLFTFIFFFYLYLLAKENTQKTTAESLRTSPLNFSFTMLFFWGVAFVGVLIMKSYGETSLILDRYFITVIPVFLLVLAIGIELMRNNILKILLITSIFIFSLFNLIIVKKYYTNFSKSQYREVASFIVENNAKNQTVYTSLLYWYDFYLSKSKTNTNLEEKTIELIVQEMMQDSTKMKEFWYADAHVRPFNPSEKTKEFLDTHFYVKNNFDGYDAWTKQFGLIKNMSRNVDISKFLPLKTFNGDQLNQYIESFETTPTEVKVSGWTYFENQDTNSSTVEILAIKDGKATKFMTEKVVRQDVTTYFNSDFDLSNSGFKSVLRFTDVTAGTYQIGIYVSNKKTGKEGLIVTDKTFTK